MRKFEKTGSSREQRYTSSISDLSDCICTRMYLCIVLLFVPVSFSLFISSIDAHIVISYIDILCSIGSSLCVAHALFLNRLWARAALLLTRMGYHADYSSSVHVSHT